MLTKYFDILEDNPHFIAINKPSGLLSIPDRLGVEDSLKNQLQAHLGKVFVVHRLDKDTSGVIIFAKTAEAHRELSMLFEGRDIEKYYVGLVYGSMEHAKGSVEVAIMENPMKRGTMLTHAKGKPSLTDYELLESYKGYSWLRFRIHTGRTHQIRVHMQHIQHTIVCDELYGNPAPIMLSSFKKKYKASKYEEEKPMLARLGLHSYELKFRFGGVDYHLEAPVPKDIRALLTQLWKASGGKKGAA